MNDYKKILFPVDFSPECRIAAGFIASYVRLFDAELILVHAELYPVEPYVWEPQTQRLTEMLEHFEADLFAGLRVRRIVEPGEPAQIIHRYATSERVDLIMMPTHGRGAIGRFLLGSVTAKVLHDAVCPVWTSAHLPVERSATWDRIDNVLCAVDLDETGVHTLRYASNFARRLGAHLTVAHAVPMPETLPEAQLDTDLRADLIESARNRLGEMQSLAGSNATVCVGAGNIAEFVNSAAQSHKANLAIIGRGRANLLGRLRTHDYAIIRRCECPVISI
jgi:nucleotide-binding universal stress UspA family protein